MIVIKRVYDSPDKHDGCRVLVDRLWPRGVSKDRAALDEWLKEAGPSNELRQWFGHKPERFNEFDRRYRRELADNPAFVKLERLAKSHDKLTLLYAARDQQHNEALLLKKYLSE